MSTLDEIVNFVQETSGIQLGKEKKLLIETRLMRRARSLNLKNLDEYQEYFLKNKDQELEQIISHLTTHTTDFFREQDHFEYLLDKVFPVLHKRGTTIKVWSAAASSGQEAYTIAICYFEYLRRNGLKSNIKIEVLGTDIDSFSIEKAKNGVYKDGEIGKIPDDVLHRYFDIGSGELAGNVRVKDEVYECCRFSTLNLLKDSFPQEKFDFIFLRNILIYFQQKDVISLAGKMLEMLADSGHLFVGHSESLSSFGLPLIAVGNAIYQSSKGLPVKTPLSAKREARKAGPIKAFIIDDSMTIRSLLRKILDKEHGFEVIGEAVNPIEAEKKLQYLKPDIITLDIHMPEMDGISYLESLKEKVHPPIVMISSINYDDAIETMRCFELGAVDYIEKPKGNNLTAEADRIRSVLKGAVESKKKIFAVKTGAENKPDSKDTIAHTADATGKELIAIGASTGGIEALKVVLTEFPENSPPVLVVQHIPPMFSGAFAKRLSECCKIKVMEAVHQQVVQPGHCYIAPGGKQMKVIRSGEGLRIEITDDAPMSSHKPSVDYLFASLVPLVGKYNMTVGILTGMGSDGAKNMKVLHDKGIHTVAQDEESSVVWGMPGKAVAYNAVTEVLPLHSIAYHLFKALRNKRAA